MSKIKVPDLSAAINEFIKNESSKKCVLASKIEDSLDASSAKQLLDLIDSEGISNPKKKNFMYGIGLDFQIYQIRLHKVKECACYSGVSNE